MATVQQQITMVAADEPVVTQHRGLWTDAYRRLIRNRFAVASILVLIIVFFVAFVGAQYGPMARFEASTIDASADAKQQGPSAEHWFGTDQLGRDMFARVMEGIRASIIIGLSTAGIVLVIGVAVGALAALGGKFSDQFVMRFTDVMFAFPDILLIILLRAILLERDITFLSNDIVVIIFAVSLVAWTTIARLVRGQMLSLGERDFVLAARSSGASSWSIIWQHMLPNTLGPVIVAVTFAIPAAIFLEAALSFIGLGIPPPAVSLGGLVSSGYSYVQKNVWAVTFPAAAVAMLMLCFTFIGDGLRDALDPRTR